MTKKSDRKKRLLHQLEYPLYIRHSEFGKTRRLSFENNASEKHQVTQAYRTYPIYKEILVSHINKKGEV